MKQSEFQRVTCDFADRVFRLYHEMRTYDGGHGVVDRTNQTGEPRTTHGTCLAMLESLGSYFSSVADEGLFQRETRSGAFAGLLNCLRRDVNGNICCCNGDHDTPHEHCPGWAHIETAEYGLTVQRCDDCGSFDDDESAAAAHDLACRCGLKPIPPVAQCNQCKNFIENERFVERASVLFCSNRCADAFTEDHDGDVAGEAVASARGR